MWVSICSSFVQSTTKISIISPMMLKILAAGPEALSVGDTNEHTLGAL